MPRRNIGPVVTGLLTRSKGGAALGGAARVYRGDVRDVERIKKVQEIMGNKENLPKFLFKPMSRWSHLDWRDAEYNDPFEALKILQAMQRETPHLSDEFIACVWVFMQDGVFPEFKSLVTNGNLPYAKPRGGNSLADVVKNQLPEGFYDASDFAQEEGVFYVQAPAQSCEAMNASLGVMKLEKDTDKIFFDNSRANADELLANDLTFGATLYSGQSDRDRAADVRLAEKARSPQLMGRQLRAAVYVNIPDEFQVEFDADGDDDQLPDSDPEASDDNVSYERPIAAVASRMAVLNKVFATKRFFAAVARIAFEAYRLLDRGFSAMEEDFEAMIAAVTGSMIERGGTNVALLGCLPGKEQTRIESLTPPRRALRWMKDTAFIEMQNGGCDFDTFEDAYVDVQGRPAVTVFAESPELLERLKALAADVENGVVGVLAEADVKAFEDKGADPPTYLNMYAGTFARALAAEAGRKGAAKLKQMRADVDNGVASPEVVQVVKKMRNGMGNRTTDEHYAACLAGGGTPRTPAGTKCGRCETTETSKWINSPDGSGGKICRTCYYYYKAGTTCGMCETTETSGWFNSLDGSGGKICQPCHARASVERSLANEAGTTCGTCKTYKSSKWYNSPDGSGGKICKACYTRAHAERLSKAGTKCGMCETTETSGWFNSLDGSGGKICRPCYTRAHAERLSKAGTKCGRCETTETSSWINSPDGSGGKICMACYNKDMWRKRQKK